MVALLNLVAAKWLFAFLPALLIWVLIRAFSDACKRLFKGRLLLAAFAFWALSVGSFISMARSGPDSGVLMLFFYSYVLSALASIVLWICSFGMFQKRVATAQTPATNEPALPDKWKEIFSLIDKAGGPKMPRFKELSKPERMKARLNWWAFFFGPFYYVSKRMWRKAITYSALMVMLILTIDYIALHYFAKDDVDLAGVAFGIFWAMLANVDYYKLKVMNQDRWI